LSQYQQEPPQHPAAVYYAAPGYAPAPPKDLTAFGVLAFSTAALQTLFTIVMASVTARQVRHQSSIDTNYDWSVGVHALATLLSMLALVAGFVTSSLWLYRARTNAELMEPGSDHIRSAGWAWAGWVCPFVSLWFPLQVVRDTARALDRYDTSWLYGWWWTFFLVEGFSLTIAFSVNGNAADGNDYAASTAQGWAVFAAATMTIALVLWGLVLRRITRQQHDRMYARTRG
jgi:uncharacterized protein DUF4328